MIQLLSPCVTFLQFIWGLFSRSFYFSINLRGYDFRVIEVLHLLSENIRAKGITRFFQVLGDEVAIVLVLDILVIDAFIKRFSVFLPDLLMLLVEFELSADLILHRDIIILPVEFDAALHVMEGQVSESVRRPIYIFLRCTYVPFLSKFSILQFYLCPANIIHIEGTAYYRVTNTPTILLCLIAASYIHLFISRSILPYCRKMGCGSSNAVIPGQPYRTPSMTNIETLGHRITPVQLLTNHTVKPESKEEPPVKVPTKKQIPLLVQSQEDQTETIEDKIVLESKKTIDLIVSQKQNTQSIFNTIPDSTESMAKLKPSRTRAKKVKKQPELPMHKQLKRLYGL